MAKRKLDDYTYKQLEGFEELIKIVSRATPARYLKETDFIWSENYHDTPLVSFSAVELVDGRILLCAYYGEHYYSEDTSDPAFVSYMLWEPKNG
jgi:hypothetical protein